ncbi:Modifier of rudimentary Modr [Trinorchestia longiramus]|nr:Modifier of rudimentary Modr [Trinorchestia longiramus]
MDKNSSYISAPIPAEVAQLKLEELEELAECEDLLEEFVMKHPQLSVLTDMCDKLTLENKALAQHNLELSRSYEAARDQTLQRVETMTSLHHDFRNLTRRSQALAQKLQHSVLKENMSIAAAESEEQSEAIAEKFLNKELDVDSFLKTYLDKRIETHLRKFKGDRLGAQLIELQKAGF